MRAWVLFGNPRTPNPPMELMLNAEAGPRIMRCRVEPRPTALRRSTPLSPPRYRLTKPVLTPSEAEPRSQYPSASKWLRVDDSALGRPAACTTAR